MKESYSGAEAPVSIPPVFEEGERAVLKRLDRELGGDQIATEKILDEVDAYFERHGGAREEDFGTYIHRVSGQYPEIIVRREKPEKLFDALESGDPFLISPIKDFHAEALYPNAGVLGWDGSGLRIPYERGFEKVGEGKVIIVVGFTADPEHLRSLPLPPNQYSHYTDLGERAKVRMVEGEVDPVRDLKFVIIRVPRALFPESKMTSDELDNEKVFYISRVYSFGSVFQKKEDH